MNTTQAVVFDAYGTLFDVYSIGQLAQELFPDRGEALTRLWRSKQLEYTWLRSLMGCYEDFETLTADALEFACRSLGLPDDPAARGRLAHAYEHLAPYAEVPGALQSLSPLPLAILSNGSPRMLRAVVENAGLAPRFSRILSVDGLRIFKPHPSVYQMAVDELGVAADRIAFVSSNFWDVSGACAFGFRTYWINRSGAPTEPLGQVPAAVLGNLAELSTVLPV